VLIFAEKNRTVASLMSCQRSVLRKKKNEMQPEPRFRGYSINTLNIYRRRPLDRSPIDLGLGLGLAAVVFVYSLGLILSVLLPVPTLLCPLRRCIA